MWVQIAIRWINCVGFSCQKSEKQKLPHFLSTCMGGALATTGGAFGLLYTDVTTSIDVMALYSTTSKNLQVVKAERPLSKHETFASTRT